MKIKFSDKEGIPVEDFNRACEEPEYREEFLNNYRNFIRRNK